MPLKNASSMVSEMAPVVLYLRFIVQPGDLLIIEEPEAHLHPEMQVLFTRLLVAAVQSGIRILITTHSEWILEELANLVACQSSRRSDVKEYRTKTFLSVPTNWALGSSSREQERDRRERNLAGCRICDLPSRLWTCHRVTLQSLGGDFCQGSRGLDQLTLVSTAIDRTDKRCHVRACREPGCSLTLKGLPDPFVLLLEHPAAPVAKSAPRCDFLFVGTDEEKSEWVVPIELTASAARVSKFLPQLRAGADIANRILPMRLNFAPSQPTVESFDERTRQLSKQANHVVFRNRATPVKLIRCGSPLTKALRD